MSEQTPDKHPTFWPDYNEPTPMMQAIQMPMFPIEKWAGGVLNAHRKRPKETSK